MSAGLSVFAIGAESDDFQQEQRLADLLVQWPISVDFKISPQQQQQQQQVANRQCNSLTMTTTSDSQQPNRCQTSRSNQTNHVCRCEHLGFVSLSTQPNQLVPIGAGGDTFGGTRQTWQPPNSFDYPSQSLGFGNELANFPAPGPLENDFTSPPATGGGAGNGPTAKMSLWASIFIVFGLALLVVTLAVLAINFVMRLASQRRLNKKQGFLSTGTSILGTNQHLHQHPQLHHRDLSGGPTTGPLAATDHNLMGGGGEQINISSGQQAAAATGAAANYKSHQQLYAAHYHPPLDLCSSLSHHPLNEPKWRRWLYKPARWISSATGRDHSRMGIQHRVLGSSLTQASSVHTYKGQFHQNGYTATGLHPHHPHHPHHHHHLHNSSGNQPSAAAAAAPSSSTSSYVSSSAYYEEIGPGNPTKVSPSQLANNNNNTNTATHTLVEPFKRLNQEQQQLLSSNNQLATAHHHHLHLHQQPQQHQQVWSPAAPGATGLTYSMDIQAANNNNNYHLSGNNNGKQQQLHNDLSHLQSQSSSSSAGSQHSASTNVTTANGSTPRHYLFASPSAVNAYKSSMSQQALQHQQHYQQQQQQSQRFAPQ